MSLAERRPGGRRAAPASPTWPPAPSAISATTSKSPVLSVSSGTSVTVTGPDELVALVAGVLAGGLGQLAGEGLGEGAEALEVGRGEVDADVVGRDRSAADPERAAVVEHAGHPVTDLDGLESAAEGLVEACLPPAARAGARTPGVPRGRVYRCTPAGHWAARRLPCRTPGEWRNWQTRRLQVPVSARTWGFKQASGACVRKDVGVQVPPRPPVPAPSRHTG